MNEVIVICPAKINLFSNVVGKDGENYFLKMVNQSIDIYDFLTIKVNSSNDINIFCNDVNVPTDFQNLCFKAALLMKTRYGIPYGFDISIVKNIPINVGLGSSSTDAAGTIIGIKKLFNLQIDNDELAYIGSLLGNNVPFFLFGGTCLIENSGEVITELAPFLDNFLIVKPDFTTNSRDIFNQYDRITPKYIDLGNFIIGYNDFEIIANPKIFEIKNFLDNFGAIFSNMSGTGPSVIAAFDSPQKRLYACQSLKKFFQNYQGYIANPCSGVQVLEKKRLN